MTTIHPGALLLLAWTATAAVAAEPDTVRTTLPDLAVKGEAVAWGDGPVPGSFLDLHGQGNLGETLENLPGVWAVRRAPSGTEPVIRGLGFERVRTLLGAVPLHGACPGRMDPPVTYLSGPAFTGVDISRRASADAGVGGVAGAVRVNPDYERSPDAVPGWNPFLATGYESARRGYDLAAGVRGGSPDVDLRATVGKRKLQDYDAPDGRTVPARLSSATANLSAGWRAAAGHRLWTAGTFVNERNIDYVALPMDNRDTDFWAWNGGWRARYGGVLDRAGITGGFSGVNHLMDNADKANRPVLEAETVGKTRTRALRARTDLAPGDWRVHIGVDAVREAKDAVRTRHMVVSGQTITDPMWPDAVQLAYGGFLGAEHDLGTGLRLAVEGRLDAVGSEARAADEPGLGGRTVREWYGAFYGPDAVADRYRETVGQASLGLGGDLARGGWRLRSGIAGRPAGITERFQAFAPAPGGYLVGNPALAPEKAWLTEAGLDLGWRGFACGLAVYHHRVADYILPTVIQVMDVNGDGSDDLVKGFVNRDATLTGTEFALEFRPRDRWLLPATLSYVRGRNTTDGRDLPEIPALGGTAELRYVICPVRGCWIGCGGRFAADQDRIDPQFGENRTGGYAVWHLQLESRPADGLVVRAAVENIFDRLYNDHLTREAATATGDLLPGDEVPAPGRSFRVSLGYGF